MKHCSCHLTRHMPAPLFAQRITIKHPGYGGNNTILVLPACDGAGASGKAYYATIYSACVIIANNHKDGWLSLSRSSQPPVSADSEGLISAGVYFFHINPGPDFEPYPIVLGCKQARGPLHLTRTLERSENISDEYGGGRWFEVQL